MTDLLIEDPGPKEEELDDKQESSLIEVSRSSALVESLTYQLEGQPISIRGQKRSFLSM